MTFYSHSVGGNWIPFFSFPFFSRIAVGDAADRFLFAFSLCKRLNKFFFDSFFFFLVHLIEMIAAIPSFFLSLSLLLLNKTTTGFLGK